jgi:hypothetical protein
MHECLGAVSALVFFFVFKCQQFPEQFEIRFRNSNGAQKPAIGLEGLKIEAFRPSKREEWDFFRRCNASIPKRRVWASPFVEKVSAHTRRCYRNMAKVTCIEYKHLDVSKIKIKRHYAPRTAC